MNRFFSLTTHFFVLFFKVLAHLMVAYLGFFLFYPIFGSIFNRELLNKKYKIGGDMLEMDYAFWATILIMVLAEILLAFFLYIVVDEYKSQKARGHSTNVSILNAVRQRPLEFFFAGLFALFSSLSVVWGAEQSPYFSTSSREKVSGSIIKTDSIVRFYEGRIAKEDSGYIESIEKSYTRYNEYGWAVGVDPAAYRKISEYKSSIQHKNDSISQKSEREVKKAEEYNLSLVGNEDEKNRRIQAYTDYLFLLFVFLTIGLQIQAQLSRPSHLGKKTGEIMEDHNVPHPISFAIEAHVNLEDTASPFEFKSHSGLEEGLDMVTVRQPIARQEEIMDGKVKDILLQLKNEISERLYTKMEKDAGFIEAILNSPDPRKDIERNRILSENPGFSKHSYYIVLNKLEI